MDTSASIDHATTTPLSNRLQGPRITFSSVKIPIEEARVFFMDSTDSGLKKIIAKFKSFLDQIESGGISEILKMQEQRAITKMDDIDMTEERNGKSSFFRERHDEVIIELKASITRIENHVATLVELARTRGIVEGINGYRSLLVVLLRILEKVGSVIDTYPFPSIQVGSPRRREVDGSTSPSMHRDSSFRYSFSALRKWLINCEPFFKQLKVVDIMIATAANLQLCSDDLLQISEATISNEMQKEHVSSSQEEPTHFKRYSMDEIVHDIHDKESRKSLKPEDVEEDIVRVVTGLSAEISAFYGQHFGCQYPTNIQLLLRTIVLANVSYSAANSYIPKIENLTGKDLIPNTAKDIFVGSLSLAYGAYYGMFPEHGAEKFVTGRSKADVQEIKNFWNLTEAAITERASALVSQSVEIDFKITLPTVRLEFARTDGTRGFVGPPSLPPVVMTRQKRSDPLQLVKCRLISYNLLTTSLEQEVQLEASVNNGNFLSKLADRLKSYSSSVPDKKRAPYVSDTLIIHFHGGGFIAQGVSSHLMYLKQWAKETNAPILSVDYSLAPEFPYPVAFQECYYAYHWALANCDKIGTTAKKVVLVGDSAGGNLAAAVTVMSIIDQARIPDGVILAYPSLYMHFVTSPSRILSVIDPLLSVETLHACFKAYIPEDVVNTLKNPFLSPGGVSDDILQKFPDTYITCGSMDPLLDDSVFFAKRLVTLGKPVRLRIFDNMPHGILNLAGVPGLGKAMSECVTLLSTWMNEVLDTRNPKDTIS